MGVARGGGGGTSGRKEKGELNIDDRTFPPLRTVYDHTITTISLYEGKEYEM